MAVGAGSRGIANIAAIVRATVDELKARGARPFIFPAMGSHGGATAEGQRDVLAHYGITEATMGCEIRASMDVVQVGEALGLPVWMDRIAAEADWIGLVNRIKPHTDFKGSIESGLFKMMTIGLGKYQGAIQYHRANVNHGYETVITAVGREVLAKARIGFGLGIVENGYDETGKVEAFAAGDLEAGERRLLKERARVDGAAALLAHRRAGRGGDGQEHFRLGHGHQRDRPALQSPRALPRRPEDPVDRRPRPHRGELRQRHRHRQRRLHHAAPRRQDRHEADAHQLHHRLLAERRQGARRRTTRTARPSRRRCRASGSRRPRRRA